MVAKGEPAIIIIDKERRKRIFNVILRKYSLGPTRSKPRNRAEITSINVRKGIPIAKILSAIDRSGTLKILVAIVSAEKKRLKQITVLNTMLRKREALIVFWTLSSSCLPRK
jgi:hypothetical protein